MLLSFQLKLISCRNFKFFRLFSNRQNQRFNSASSVTKEPNPDEPLKFIGSDAQKFKAREIRVGTSDTEEIPWFQVYSVIGSVAIFLIYFCILREENDIDAQLSRPIFETVPQLEKNTLITLYKYNLEKNIDNTDVIRRMLQIGIDPLKIE